MASNPQCAAVAAAQKRTGLSYKDIADKIGSTEAHVTAICTGTQRPTEPEFKKLATALGITSPLPHDKAHTA